MSEQNEMAEKVSEYIERSFTDPSFRPIMGGDLEIVMSGKMPEQYVGVSDVFKAIIQFANALTVKGRESFTPMELQLTLFTLIADVVVDTDVAPVVHGEWLTPKALIQCSHCGFGMFPDGYYFDHGVCVHANESWFRPDYCPQCGAKMDGGDQQCK